MHCLRGLGGGILDEVAFIKNHVTPLAVMRELVDHVGDELV